MSLGDGAGFNPPSEPEYLKSDVLNLLERKITQWERRLKWLETCNNAYQKHGNIKVVKERDI